MRRTRPFPPRHYRRHQAYLGIVILLLILLHHAITTLF
jgi:hypothetical protein